MRKEIVTQVQEAESPIKDNSRMNMPRLILIKLSNKHKENIRSTREKQQQ